MGIVPCDLCLSGFFVARRPAESCVVPKGVQWHHIPSGPSLTTHQPETSTIHQVVPVKPDVVRQPLTVATVTTCLLCNSFYFKLRGLGVVLKMAHDRQVTLTPELIETS